MTNLLLVLLALFDAIAAFEVSQAPSSLKKRRRSVELKSVVANVVDESNNLRRFMYMTKEQDAILQEKGSHEAELMKHNAVNLKPSKVKKDKNGASVGKGFGGATSRNKQSTEGGAQAHAKVLQKDGLVRIDNVLSDELADTLKDYLVDLRARATADIESGRILDSQERFADVLLNQNRCDLKIPLGPEPVNQALHYILSQSPIRQLIEHVFNVYGDDSGGDATLYELNCFMSNSGARRQLVHADNVCVEPGLLQEDEPVMLTTFVALQDTDATMGPTTWILGTHNRESHAEFYGSSVQKDDLLKTRRKVTGTLPKGAAVVFDPRTLHCAGANECSDPDMTRALFYVSFKNPRVDHPGCPSCSGYGIVNADLSIRELTRELNAQAQDRPSRRLDFLACSP